MIKPAFIKSQTVKSLAQGRTTGFLRRLVFSVVDSVAAEHYGAAYSMKCLQVSAVLQAVLARVGVKSRLWAGALCVAEVFDEPGHESWGGFWGEDHHIWLATEFQEIVDLSISQTHQHPRRRRDDGVPVPAIWWSNATQWPPVIRYLPDTPIHGVGLQGEDARDMAEFEAKALRAFDEYLRVGSVHGTSFARMLTGVESMNEALDDGAAWSTRAIVFQERGIPFPDWIREREQELMRFGLGAPSRLQLVPDLFQPMTVASCASDA